MIDARFWSKVDRSGGPEACWPWLAYANQKGYGRVSRSGVLVMAHRVAYEAMVGPIPAGLTLDHLCRNRGCVNPAHLEPVTNRENALRGEGIQAQNALKTHCPNGHPYSGDNLYLTPRGTRDCRACGYKAVRIPCREPFLRHRWEWVRGTMATPDHEYVERRCKRCGEYESEVR